MKFGILRVPFFLIPLLTSLPTIALAQSGLVSKKVSQTWVEQKGTRDYALTRAFLLQTANGVYEAQDLTSDRLGDFTIGLTQNYSASSTGTLSSQVATLGANDPPYQPPTGGNANGDVFSIKSCSHGEQQQWTWVFVSDGKGGGAWVLTSYSFNYVHACVPSN